MRATEMEQRAGHNEQFDENLASTNNIQVDDNVWYLDRSFEFQLRNRIGFSK